MNARSRGKHIKGVVEEDSGAGRFPAAVLEASRTLLTPACLGDPAYAYPALLGFPTSNASAFKPLARARSTVHRDHQGGATKTYGVLTFQPGGSGDLGRRELRRAEGAARVLREIPSATSGVHPAFRRWLPWD